MDKVPMTPDGFSKLERELKQLKSTDRHDVVRAIAEAREHGDLSENAEYHAARERQSFIEGRIGELEDLISRAEVIDASSFSGDVVRFGANVVLTDEDTEKEVAYTIVGVHESDIASGRISITSPLGRALIGKSLGDVVEVSAPRGAKSYEIVKVVYG